MGTVNLYFNSHITGNVSEPNNALDAPDGTFTTDTGSTNWTSRWEFTKPASSENFIINGTQTIIITCRRSGSGNGSPTINSVTLYQDGSSVEVIRSTSFTPVSGGGTDTLTITFNGNLLDGFDKVQLQLATSGGGGGPNANSIQVDGVKWEAAYVEDISTIIKTWNGDMWIEGSLKKWDGDVWIGVQLKRWTGSEWVIV